MWRCLHQASAQRGDRLGRRLDKQHSVRADVRSRLLRSHQPRAGDHSALQPREQGVEREESPRRSTHRPRQPNAPLHADHPPRRLHRDPHRPDQQVHRRSQHRLRSSLLFPRRISLFCLSSSSRPFPTPPIPSPPTGSRTTGSTTPPTSSPPTGTSPSRSSFSTRRPSSRRTGWTTSRWRSRTPR